MINILITQFRLAALAGSELFTRDLAINLSRIGYKVTVYSPFPGLVSSMLQQQGIEYVSDLKQLRDRKFDLIHAHHNITAILVRKYFPNTPIVLMVHGPLPFLEQPPSVETNISSYIVISEEIKNHLVKSGINAEEITIARNWVNTELFSYVPPSPVAKKILVISNHYFEPQKQLLDNVCKSAKLDLTHIGAPQNPVENTHQYIKESDIVVTIGRGVLEAAACGKNIIVWDIHGADGMLTRQNYHTLRKKNFSGRTYRLSYNEQSLLNEFQKYDPKNGMELHKVVIKEHGANVWSSIEQSYKRAMQSGPVKINSYPLPVDEIEFLVEEMRNREVIMDAKHKDEMAVLERRVDEQSQIVRRMFVSIWIQTKRAIKLSSKVGRVIPKARSLVVSAFW